jgi:hypothetical protein
MWPTAVSTRILLAGCLPVCSQDSGATVRIGFERVQDGHILDDSLRQHLANLLHSQHEPLDVLSVHMYGNFGTRRKMGNLPHLELLRHYARAAHAASMPIFVGELGQAPPSPRTRRPGGPRRRSTCSTRRGPR